MASGEYLNKKCPVCLKPLWGFRRSKVYCSAACKQRSHRKPAPESQLKKYYDDAHLAIMQLVVVSGRGLDGYRAEQRLKALVFDILQHSTEDLQRRVYNQLRDVYGS
jgi:hypothetical protein